MHTPDERGTKASSRQQVPLQVISEKRLFPVVVLQLNTKYINMSAPRVKMVAAFKKKKKKDDVYLKLTVPTKKEKLQYLCAQTKNNSL